MPEVSDCMSVPPIKLEFLKAELDDDEDEDEEKNDSVKRERRLYVCHL